MKPKLLVATLGGGRLLKHKSSVLVVAAFGAAGLYGAISASAAPPSKTAVDAENARYAQTMLDEGKKTFRYETFGSEVFWGDTLQLHKAIAGEKNGGVGPGVSPKTALSVGLKVDADALPGALKQQIKATKVNLDDPATTIALLKLNAVVGVTAFANPDGSVKSMGIQCAFCHSTVDNSFAPGIGKRLDGWANRDLNVGAIVSLAPNLKPLTDLLGVDVETVKKVLASWGPGRYDAELDKDGKAFRPDGKQAGTLIPPAFGLAGVNLATWTGFGSLTYWNAYVAGTQMHGAATFFDARSTTRINIPSPRRVALAIRGIRRTRPQTSWPRCTSISSRSQRRRHRQGHMTKLHPKGERPSSMAPRTARPVKYPRSSRSQDTTCMHPARSESTRFRPTVRRPTCIARHR